MQQVSKIQIKEIQEMIKACGGNKRMAAELLDITPWTLYDRWRKAGLPVDKARWNKRRKR
jgi:DNA-binding NtrC family response regulator